MHKRVNQKGTASQCDSCIHHVQGLICRAFGVIPEKVVRNFTRHDRVLEGQFGTFIYSNKKYVGRRENSML